MARLECRSARFVFALLCVQATGCTEPANIQVCPVLHYAESTELPVCDFPEHAPDAGSGRNAPPPPVTETDLLAGPGSTTPLATITAYAGSELVGRSLAFDDGSFAMRLTSRRGDLSGQTVRVVMRSGIRAQEQDVVVRSNGGAKLAWTEGDPYAGVTSIGRGQLEVRYHFSSISPAYPASPMSEIVVMNATRGGWAYTRTPVDLDTAFLARVPGQVGDTVVVVGVDESGATNGCYLLGSSLGDRCRCTKTQIEAGHCSPRQEPDFDVAVHHPAPPDPSDAGVPY